VIEAVERKNGALMHVAGIAGAGLMVLSDFLLLFFFMASAVWLRSMRAAEVQRGAV